jgi:aromatic amino acid aminotransferase I
MLQSKELDIISVNMNKQGLLPEDLAAKLQGRDAVQGKKPFVQYMIPTGQNPSGTTQSYECRESIY